MKFEKYDIQLGHIHGERSGNVRQHAGPWPGLFFCKKKVKLQDIYKWLLGRVNCEQNPEQQISPKSRISPTSSLYSVKTAQNFAAKKQYY